MASIGYFIDDLELLDPPILTYIRDYHHIADALIETNCDVEKFSQVERASDYDIVILPEAWSYHGYPMGEVFEQWCLGELDFEVPVIVHIIHVREEYSHRDYQPGMINRADGFIVASDYRDNLDKPSVTLKFGTYPIDTKLDEMEKDDTIRAPMGRVAERPLRVKALQECPLELKLIGKSKGDDSPYQERIDLPENIEYSGGYEEGMDVFRKSKFVFEAETRDWHVPELDPQPYWSDRVGHAVSHGAHLITNYQPALEQWESTISYEEAYNEGLEYDLEAIKRDREKWLYENRVENLEWLFEEVTQ